MRIGGWGKTNQKGVLGVDKTPGELISKGGGVVETANQKGVLGLGKTLEDPKSKRGGWKNDQPEGSPRGG